MFISFPVITDAWNDVLEATFSLQVTPQVNLES